MVPSLPCILPQNRSLGIFLRIDATWDYAEMPNRFIRRHRVTRLMPSSEAASSRFPRQRASVSLTRSASSPDPLSPNDFPVFASSTLGPLSPHTDLGDIDWFGATALSTLKKVGPGTLNVFGSAALSRTHPNGKTVVFNGIDTGAGLMFSGESKSTTGEAFYVGGRYDFPSTRTKIGAEYNYGSKNWITFVPAGDDIWTSKLGTRGSVYEVYLIQEIDAKPVSSYFAKTFFRFGFQYYDFDYTGSNNWVGAPVKVADLAASPMNAQMLTPLKNARDIYGTFEVKF